MSKDEFVIGIVGGMGSYATLNFFERILNAFPAEKEWERPRVIIDNRCTMPSRVRAVLYNEKENEVIDSIQESIEYLIEMGGENTSVILACNTSHIFLNAIFERNPLLEKYIVNIIEECAKNIKKDNIDEVFIIATEGTIDSRIYHKTFEKYGIKVKSPSKEGYAGMRYYIELIKQNKLNEQNIESFEKYLEDFNERYIILGCTEFSALYGKVQHVNENINIIDPLEIAINTLKCKWSSMNGNKDEK